MVTGVDVAQLTKSIYSLRLVAKHRSGPLFLLTLCLFNDNF